MDEWYDTLGAYATVMPPAVAADLALHGPPPGQVGYPLAHSMLRTDAELDPYPQHGQLPQMPEEGGDGELVY